MSDALTCQFTSTKRSCGAPADHHLLVDEESVSRACDDHLARAVARLDPIDSHEHGEFCCLSTLWEPRLRWRLSTEVRAGFCYIEDDERFENIEVRDLVVHGPVVPNSGETS